MDSVLADVRFALRTLRRSPVFTAVAVLTLALGIGANTAIFSVVNGLLLTPLPLARPDRLVFIQGRSTQGYAISVSIPNALDWHANSRSFQTMGAMRPTSLNLTGRDAPERLQAIQVLGDLFPTLGIAPAVGRTFGANETMQGAPAIAVLSHGFWQRRFAGRPDALGQALTLDGRPFTVTGVMPPEFAFPSSGVDVFVPMGAFADRVPWDQRGNHPGMYVVARLKDGVTLAWAQADMNDVMGEIRRRTGYENAAELTSLRQRLLGEIEPALLVLSGAVGFVLLIACANVANLLLARGEGRERELAVRTALGASRGRVTRLLLTESVLLSLAGGAAGLALAAVGVKALIASLPASTPLLERIGIDAPALLFTSALAVGTGLVFGLLPALRASGAALHAALKEGSRGGDGAGRQRLRSALVVSEMTLALVLLVGAALMIQSVANLQRVDAGFTAERVLTARVALPAGAYDAPERWQGLYRQLVDRVRALPGVQFAAVNNGVPLASGGTEAGIIPEGRPVTEASMESALWQTPSADYFQAMRIPLRRGRYFTDQDRRGSPLVAIIDETMAEKFWPGQDPIGKRVTFEYTGDDPANLTPHWREVVGVVANVRHYELQSPSRIQVYRPYDQNVKDGNPPSLALFVRATGDPAELTAAVRRELAALDPDLPLFGARTMADVVDEEMATSRLLGGLLSVFATVALVLAAVGIYGVMSYAVSARTREIGVRMALGARPGDVLRMIVWRGGLLAGAGVAVGLLIAFGVTRAMTSALYQVSATDPTTFALIPLALLAVALAATYAPARRATRVDPAVALRAQ